MATFAGTADGPPFRIDYGTEVEPEIASLVERIAASPDLSQEYEPRWLAVKLLEEDEQIAKKIGQM